MGFAIREKAEQLLAFQGVRLFLMEMVARWTPTTPELEAKVLFGRQIWDAARHADMLGKRTLELRASQQPAVKLTHDYVRTLERMAAQTGTAERIQCLYEVILPGLAKQYQRYLANTHHLQDEPTVRILDSIQRDDDRIIQEAHDTLAQMDHLVPAGPELPESLRVDDYEIGVKTIRGVTLRGDPAREPCFRVVSTADEMFDMAGMSPESRRERLHRHMSNEVVAIEIAAQCLVDFPDADWDLRLQLARQCWDESRHATALKRRLLELGGFKGEFPISTYEWNVTSILDSLAARLAVQNRTFEAGLMDLLGGLRKLWRAAGDDITADVLESILADEVGHVRFANQWIRGMATADRKVLLQVAQGIGFLQKAAITQIRQDSGAEDNGRDHYQLGEVNVEDRKLAGFTDDEINSFLTSVGLASVLPPKGAGGGLMSSSTPEPLDPALFAEGPSRDPRFNVVEHWSECRNFPRDHPERDIEFFHRQMHEELCSVENAARNLSDFPDAPWEVRMSIARQCADEARHVLMFRELCEQRGGKLGSWPVMDFQYRICTNISTLIGRLAVQNRTFEAGGIDAVSAAIKTATESGDSALADLYEMQWADEIQHVRFANEWIRVEARKSPRVILQMAAALHASTQAFHQVMGDEAIKVEYGADLAGRREAGFNEEEIRVAAEQSDQRLSGTGPLQPQSNLSMPTSLLFLKIWFQEQPGFVRTAIIALLLTSFYWPLIWFIERRWGNGVKHYRSHNFFHDFAYWLYYRFGIHYLLFELWIFVPLNAQLSFLRFDLLKRLPVPIEWVLSYVVFDFISYWMHRWQHSSATLWAFHALHHTPENLSFATQVRVHPFDRLITTFCVLVPALVLGSQTMIWVLFVAKDFVTLLEHAQVGWTYGRFYKVFVSPAFHKVHHSTLDSEQRSNYGVALSVWDYMFGTAKPAGTRPAALGIPEYPSGSLWRQMLLPFRILGKSAP